MLRVWLMQRFPTAGLAGSALPSIPGAHEMPAWAIELLDIANGLAVRAEPAEVSFPNIDLTAHLFAEPSGDCWASTPPSRSAPTDSA